MSRYVIRELVDEEHDGLRRPQSVDFTALKLLVSNIPSQNLSQRIGTPFDLHQLTAFSEDTVTGPIESSTYHRVWA